MKEIHINYPFNEDSSLDVWDNLDDSNREMVDEAELLDDEEEELNESDEESSFL